MKTIVSIFLLQLSIIYSADAQKRCGEHIATQQLIDQNPAIRQAVEQAEIDRIAISANTQKTTGTVYIIPIVFHILHQNGPENISDAQIYDAMRVLNEDFRKLNADNADVIPDFQGITADAEIEFRLAQKDPSGNCTSGIDRILSPLTNNGDDNAKLNPWPRNKYLNVWVVNDITIGAGVAGYAYKPSAAAFMPTKDGIMILHDYTGSIGTATGTEPHSLSHEVGHYLNLSHTWGPSNDPGLPSNCNTDDGIGDTPNTIGWTSCNLAGVTCGTLDNVQNFMDYSFCSNMFTLGQANVMRTTLITAISQRNNLSTNANLIATGTDGNNTLCVADILHDLRSACLGEDYTFYDASYHAPTSWNWTISNSNPSSSTNQNPTVSFLSEGYVDVDLTVSNTSGTQSITENQFLRVLPNSGIALPVSEGFENGTYPSLLWDIDNLGEDAYTWSQFSGAAYSGSKSIKMSNLGSASGQIDELISPLYDFSNVDQVTINFKIAFAQKTGSNDYIKIYASGDCGKTWTIKFARNGAAFSSVPAQNADFTPSGTSQWRDFTFSFSNSNLLTEKVLLKFSFEANGGNNCYIDDINITGLYNLVPVLSSPSNGAIFSSTDTLIDWKAVVDADSYDYEVDTTTLFNSPVLIQGNNIYIDNSHSNADTEHSLSNLISGKTYYWRVRANTAGSPGSWSDTWSFTVDQSISSALIQNAITEFKAFPNPFIDQTTLSFSVVETGMYSIELFDLNGRKIDAILKNAQLGKGTYTIHYENKDISGGIYMIRFGNEKNLGFEKISLVKNQ